MSAAKAFPRSTIIAVELGGNGGKIWSKTRGKDVHTEQEEAISNHSVQDSMVLCQTLVLPEMFATLRKEHQKHHYQFVLSVFHWFQLPTRLDFERVVADLFSNARTTFIELPTIGDKSKLIRQQTGYKFWSRWYDDRTDVAVILEAAIAAQGMKAKVTLVASLPWLSWQRVVYRVDVTQVSSSEAGAESWPFDCEAHRRIYGCRPRRKHQVCPKPAAGGAEHHEG